MGEPPRELTKRLTLRRISSRYFKTDLFKGLPGYKRSYQQRHLEIVLKVQMRWGKAVRAFGKFYPDEITKEIAKRFHSSIVKSHGSMRAGHCFRALKELLRWAYRNNLADPQVLSKLRVGAVQESINRATGRYSIPSREQTFKAIRWFLEHPRHKGYGLLLWCTYELVTIKGILNMTWNKLPLEKLSEPLQKALLEFKSECGNPKKVFLRPTKSGYKVSPYGGSSVAVPKQVKDELEDAPQITPLDVYKCAVAELIEGGATREYLKETFGVGSYKYFQIVYQMKKERKNVT